MPRGKGTGSTGVAAWLRHALCVLALAWTGLANGQPFFFPDTTNYIRAADAAVHIASGRRIATVWTRRYAEGLERPAPAAAAPPTRRINDAGGGTIMAGRSPYFGALLWLAWVSASFWPFVLAQAAIAYALVLLALRRLEVATIASEIGTVAVLAMATVVPTYNSLLLADMFGAFGVLALLLLAWPGAMGRWERGFLFAVVIVSATFHLTHIVMAIAMLAAFAAGRWLLRLPVAGRAWIAGALAVAIGLVSVQATGLATRIAFGRPAQLLPLLTARLYMDGPGRDFIAAGCDGRAYTICRLPIGMPPGNQAFLFSPDPNSGAFLMGDADQRRRMGEEDVAFARAVFARYPLRTAGAMAFNTIRQLLWVSHQGLNQGCFDRPDCWESLPEEVRARLAVTPSGRNAWPEAAMSWIVAIACAAAAIALPLLLRRMRASRDALWPAALAWTLAGGAAVLANAFLGGAVADPQYRFGARLSWLIVLTAILFWLRLRRSRAADRAAPAGSA